MHKTLSRTAIKRSENKKNVYTSYFTCNDLFLVHHVLSLHIIIKTIQNTFSRCGIPRVFVFTISPHAKNIQKKKTSLPCNCFVLFPSWYFLLASLFFFFFFKWIFDVDDLAFFLCTSPARLLEKRIINVLILHKVSSPSDVTC